MGHAQLPIASLPLWQTLNNIVVSHVRIADIPGKGAGLVAEDDIDGIDDASRSRFDAPSLIAVPESLVLHADAVAEYAKQDRNVRQLLDAVGHETPRGDVLLFLLVQRVLGRRQHGDACAALPTPWTEYARFLPASADAVPLPTLWSDTERRLLQGTSLEPAVAAKRTALELEFDRLRDRSSDIPFWQAAFWECAAGPSLDDWCLIDAWYRSRCLALPRAGPAMVPCIDMVNHSAAANAYYDEVAAADGHHIVLRLRPGQHVAAGDEITISYSGDGRSGTGTGSGTRNDNDDDHDDHDDKDAVKSASEMLFSYGFVDADSARHSLVLPVRPFPDDPLAKAKLHAFGQPPRLTVERWRHTPARAETDPTDPTNPTNLTDPTKSTESTEQTETVQATAVQWHCPFVYLMCVNEEDGIDFRLRQETDGSAQLRVFWQDNDVTDNVRDFAALTRTHALAPVIQLRVVTVLQEIMESHLERMQAAGGYHGGGDDNDDDDDDDNENGDDSDNGDGAAGQGDTEMTGRGRQNDNGDDSEDSDDDDGNIRSSVATQAALLRDIESQVLSSALEALEAERSDLLSNVTVVAYLGSMEVSQNDLACGEAPNHNEADEPMRKDHDDEDFS